MDSVWSVWEIGTITMRMEWLVKKQTPDMKLYHPDTSVPITTKDAQALDRKIEEIKEK